MSRRTLRKLGRYLALIAVATVFVGPFLVLLSTALKPASQPVFSFPPEIIPTPPVIDWVVRAWTQISFPTYLRNSVVLVLMTVPPYLVVSTLAAYPLARMRFRGRQVFFYLILATMFLPGEVLLVPRYLVVSQLGLVDSFWGVALPGVLSAFGIFLLRQSFAIVPKDLEDAARLDGANEWRIFYSVMLPQVRPTLATLSIFGFISVWNGFIWPLVVLQTPEKYPLALGLAYLTGILGGDDRTLAAGTVISLVPIIIFFLVMQRHFIEGMKGSIK